MVTNNLSEGVTQLELQLTIAKIFLSGKIFIVSGQYRN
jgi:hypothetical protein